MMRGYLAHLISRTEEWLSWRSKYIRLVSSIRIISIVSTRAGESVWIHRYSVYLEAGFTYTHPKMKLGADAFPK